jgi:dihydrofolate reductase
VIALVAALDRGRAIGRGGALPWHLPDDLRRFKALTLGKPVLMGRRTAESLGRALPGRENLVLTHRAQAPHPGMTVVPTLEAALAHAGARDLMVIGGGEVYALALPRAGALHMTHVDTEVAGADAYFPPLDPDAWRELARVHHGADARHAWAFDFVDYARA